jgi:hypothetical protein
VVLVILYLLMLRDASPYPQYGGEFAATALAMRVFCDFVAFYTRHRLPAAQG